MCPCVQFTDYQCVKLDTTKSEMGVTVSDFIFLFLIIFFYLCSEQNLIIISLKSIFKIPPVHCHLPITDSWFCSTSEAGGFYLSKRL